MVNLVSINEDKAFIIAEAGVNHNGDIRLALKMVDAAVDAGVDAIKFQSFRTEKLVSLKAEKAEYQKSATGGSESQFEMLKKLELSYESHLILQEYCKKKGIIFLSTPFDTESVDLLDNLGVEIFKVSSGDLTNMPMLKYIAEKKKPVILSTGMADIEEIREAVKWVRESGEDTIYLLHCTTEYPTPYEEVNLNAMNSIKQLFNLPVGYSDHTKGIEIPIAAVAMGACIIEKHFTLDRNMEGPDHKASLEPDELKAMVSGIRNIEKAKGDGIKRPSKTELTNIRAARKSIVAACRIPEGKKLTLEDFSIKRPGNGIEPKHLYSIVGAKSKRNISAEETIKWEDIDI